jgi:flavin reductase (DIM6/NTAB) family NADH-FMN oxidoreductase RutF
MVAADFVGIVSAKNDADKMAKTGWKCEKSENVNAPVFTDFPMTLECRIKEKIDESEEGYYIVAEIVNISWMRTIWQRMASPTWRRWNSSCSTRYIMVTSNLARPLERHSQMARL